MYEYGTRLYRGAGLIYTYEKITNPDDFLRELISRRFGSNIQGLDPERRGHRTLTTSLYRASRAELIL